MFASKNLKKNIINRKQKEKIKEKINKNRFKINKLF